MSDSTEEILGRLLYATIDLNKPPSAGETKSLGGSLYSQVDIDPPPGDAPSVVDPELAQTVHPGYEMGRLLYGEAGDSGESPGGKTEKESDTATVPGAKDDAHGAKSAETDSEVDLTLVVPTGFEIDQERLNSFKAVAAEAGISKENQQRLLDFHGAALREQVARHEERVAEWASAAKQDREIGGRLFDSAVARARGVLDQYAEPGLIEVLESSGLGSHPEMIRLLARVASDIRTLVAKET